MTRSKGLSRARRAKLGPAGSGAFFIRLRHVAGGADPRPNPRSVGPIPAKFWATPPPHSEPICSTLLVAPPSHYRELAPQTHPTYSSRCVRASTRRTQFLELIGSSVLPPPTSCCCVDGGIAPDNGPHSRTPPPPPNGRQGLEAQVVVEDHLHIDGVGALSHGAGDREAASLAGWGRLRPAISSEYVG